MSDLSSPHLSPERLAALNRGALGDAESANLRRHLDACAVCREALAALPRETLASHDRPPSAASRSGPAHRPSGLPAGSVTTDHLPPEFGRYRILKKLGQGGMGAVYLAHDTQLDRKVALKVPQFDRGASPQQLERFFREAKAAAAFDHPNLCPVYDAGTINGTHYLTMPFIEGKPLSDYARPDKPLAQQQAAKVVRKVALAVAEAHKRGVVHRDLKPANVMINQRGEPVVMDFGLARMDTGEAARLTGAGAILGTPSYMAPEQVRGEQDKIGPLCDVYALGVILFELLTGRRPFEGPTTAVLARILIEPPPAIVSMRPDVDPKLAAVCERAMVKEPAERFASMEAFAKALTEYLAVPPSAAPPVPRPEKSVPPPLPPPSVHRRSVAPTSPGSQLSFPVEAPTAAKRVRERKRQWRVAAWAGAGLIAVIVFIASFAYLAGGGRKSPGDGDKKANGSAPAEKKSAEALPATYKNRLGMEFVHVPKGKSWLGGGDGRPGDREIEIKEDFYLGKYEVTQGDWAKLMRSRPSHFGRAGGGAEAVKDIPDEELEQFPVELVSWDEAQLFLAELNKRDQVEGWKYRLPTQVEWEYACRGGPMTDRLDSTFSYYFERPTNQFLPAQANFEHADKRLNRTRKVGSYKPNRLGLFDMHGNVWEWCDDLFAPNDNNPPWVRGGGWNNISGQMTATVRGAIPSSHRHSNQGLRVARVPVGKEGQPAVGPAGTSITNSIGMKLKLIPAGEFLMGSPTTDPDAQPEEIPQRTVRIGRPFYLGVHEVTVAQFRAFVTARNVVTRAERTGMALAIDPSGNSSVWRLWPGVNWKEPGFKQEDDHPVVAITWTEANDFCDWLGGKEGRTYRLPTAAEWEYACRAGTTTRFETGDLVASLRGHANIADASLTRAWPRYPKSHPFGPHVSWDDGYAFTSPVGKFPANAWGFHDMHGNVREFVGPVVAFRGGSFGNGNGVQRCASVSPRDWSLDSSDFAIGFRVACEAPVVPTAGLSTP